MTTDEEIKVAEANLAKAKDLMSEIHSKLNDLYRRRSKEKFGIEPGVRVRKGDGREGIVKSVRPDAYTSSKPWIYVNPIKKDGTPGEREQCFYSHWEIVSP